MLGVSVLATVFTAHGGYTSPQAFVDGLQPAMWVGTAVLAIGALVPLVFPFSTRATAAEQASVEAAEKAHAQDCAWRQCRPERRVRSTRYDHGHPPNTEAKTSRQRVPAAERRDALIEAAVHEFAHGGLHGTPVDRIARNVGVAQPYVFSLFGSKRELFLAAVERCFSRWPNVHPGRRPSSIRPSRCPTRRAAGDGQRLCEMLAPTTTT